MKRIFIFFISFFSYLNSSYAQGEFQLSHNLDLPIGDYALHVDSNSLQLLQIPFFGLDVNFYSTPHIGDFISKNNTNWLINIQDYSNHINDLSLHFLDLKNHLFYYALNKEYTVYSFGLDHNLWIESSLSKNVVSLIANGNYQYLNETINLNNSNNRLYNYLSCFFGYSQKLSNTTVGGKIRFIKGIYSLGFQDTGTEITFIDNYFTMNTPFTTNINSDFNYFVNSDYSLFSNLGFAVDLSFQHILSEDISFYGRISDLGFIFWKEDQYISSGVFSFDGLDYSVDEDLIQEFSALYDTVFDVLDIQENNNISSLRWLPYDFDFGVSYVINESKNNCFNINYNLQKLHTDFLHTSTLSYITYWDQHKLQIIPMYSFNKFNYTNLSLFLSKKWKNIIFTNIYIDNILSPIIKNSYQSRHLGLEIIFLL